MRIVFGKFDNKIDLSGCSKLDPKHKVRIGSRNPNTLRFPIYMPIATDGKVIINSDGEGLSREFLSRLRSTSDKQLIVLTHKERSLILEELLNFNTDVAVFESLYPFFTNIKYTAKPSRNLKALISLLKDVRRLKINGRGIAHQLSTKNQFKIERALRHKNRLDRFFLYGYQGGYQEVFKLREEQADRVIVAFDFNSMFASCFDGDFVKPTSVRFKHEAFNYDGKSPLASGMYRVLLKNPKNDYFNQYHPFKYKRLGRSFTFNLDQHHELELLLFSNEIEYYSRFFKDTQILESLAGDSTIKHPLYNDALKVYEKRRLAKNSTIDWENSFYKFWLVTLHGASNPRGLDSKMFLCSDHLKIFLTDNFSFNFDKSLDDDRTFNLLNRQKNFSIEKHKDGYRLSYPILNNSKAILSLSSQVLANSRVKMMKIMNQFKLHHTVEFCYANIDSLHISINRDQLKPFLESNQNLISDRLGDLKIQCIADRGYWFDVGRYWLFKNGEVEQFKNILFNHQATTRKFIRHREFKSVEKDADFSYIKSTHRAIENSFSYNKKVLKPQHIDFTNFTRYSFAESESLSVAGESYEQEIMDSKALKVDLFNRIATE